MVKRLAYITSMATGGLSGFNYRELKEMVRLGVNITLFVTKYRKGPYMAPASVKCEKIRFISSLFNLILLLLLYPIKTAGILYEAICKKAIIDFFVAIAWSKIIEREKCEWIHCHWGDHKLYIGYFCHKFTNKPLSVTLHGYDLYANPNWTMMVHCLRACSKIITISEYNRNFLTSRINDLKVPIQVIRLSADLPPIKVCDGSRKNILIVGGFHFRKGYDDLLAAIKYLNRDDLHLWIVGYKGPVDVPAMVKQLGIEDKVTIFGHIDDKVLKVLYSKCDIFCLPSKFPKNGIGEGLPVSLMEAMSYGKPVVSTTHTGIPELVPQILVPEGNPKFLADAIARLADNPELRRELGLNNRLIVEKKFSNDNVFTLLESFSS